MQSWANLQDGAALLRHHIRMSGWTPEYVVAAGHGGLVPAALLVNELRRDGIDVLVASVGVEHYGKPRYYAIPQFHAGQGPRRRIVVIDAVLERPELLTAARGVMPVLSDTRTAVLYRVGNATADYSAFHADAAPTMPWEEGE